MGFWPPQIVPQLTSDWTTKSDSHSLPLLQQARQQARRYATESGSSPSPSGGSNTFAYLAGAGVLGGAGYWYMSGTPAAAKVSETVGVPAKPAFTGGDQGFISLKLSHIENVNHNTKLLRFELPEGDMVSGLQVASALLTKYKGPEDEKPTLRPYTPVSDEGTTRVMAPKRFDIASRR
jgi:cytochrome-b5 reductase